MSRDYLIDAVVTGPDGVKREARYFTRAERPMDAYNNVDLVVTGNGGSVWRWLQLLARNADGEYGKLS